MTTISIHSKISIRTPVLMTGWELNPPKHERNKMLLLLCNWLWVSWEACRGRAVDLNKEILILDIHNFVEGK